MNCSSQPWETQQAWELAWQIRFCPPDDLLTANNTSDEMRAHLKSCPECLQRLVFAQTNGPWPDLPGAGPRTDKTGAGDSLAIQPGQIRMLKRKLAGWGPKSRYFNPPVVVILRSLPTLPNGVLVAQTYQQSALMGDDDILLSPDRFAEPWNLYTVHRGYLGRLCGQADQETVEQILAASRRAPDEFSPWAPLSLFRQMEIELGFFFSARAVFTLMEEYERQADDLQSGSAPPDLEAPAGLFRADGPLDEKEVPAGLKASLLELGLVLPEDKTERLAADLYFLATPPEHQIAMAAAQTERDHLVSVVAYCLEAGKPVAWHYLEAEITDFLRSPKVVVGGKFGSALPPGGNWQAEFRWQDDSGQMIKSQASYLEHGPKEARRFWAYFPVEAPSDHFKVARRLFIRLFEV